MDNLLPQIPRSFVRSFDAEFKVSVGLLSAAVKGTSTDSGAELSARVGLLSTYLNEVERIGSVMLPERYVRGTASLRYGVVGERAAEVAFFEGVVDHVKVGLSRIAGSDSELAAEPPHYSHSAAIRRRRAGSSSWPGRSTASPTSWWPHRSTWRWSTRAR